MEKKEIGRHVLAGLPGLTVDDHTRQLIQEWHIAGVVLFARNFKDAAQFQALTTELQRIAQAAGYTQPLLIALDQENGVIRRINRDASLFPGAMTIAATGEPANAYRMYRASALELRALGVNWNLAPDADVNTNPANPVIGGPLFRRRPPPSRRLCPTSGPGHPIGGDAGDFETFPRAWGYKCRFPSWLARRR